MQIWVNYLSDEGCSNQKKINLHTDPLPNTFAGSDLEICSDRIHLEARKNPDFHGEWQLENNLINGSTNPNYLLVVENDGIYNLTWTEINVETGCRNSDDVNVTFFSKPENFVAAMEIETDKLLVNQRLMFKTTTENVNEFLWDFGDGSIDNLNLNSMHSYNYAGTYYGTLFVIDINGCSDRLPFEITVGTHYIPNSFTPNGDRINDVLRPEGTAFSGFSMSVYNRWGENII